MERSLVIRFGAIGDYVTAVEFCRAHEAHDLLFCPSIECFICCSRVVPGALPLMAPTASSFVIRFGGLDVYDALVRGGQYGRAIVLSQGPGGRKIALAVRLLKMHRWWRVKAPLVVSKYFHGGQYAWQLNQASQTAALIKALPPQPNVAIFYDSKETANNLSAETVAHVVRGLATSLVKPRITVYGVKRLRLSAELSCTNLSGETTLDQLATVIDQVQLAVTCDSGPLHALSARGVPCIAFMSARQPVLNWTPLTPKNYYVFEDSLECLGCGQASCPRGENICVNSSSTWRKFDAVLS